MNKLFVFLLVSFLSIHAGAQSGFTVSGKVFDSASREPLVAASVFCQNTTQGTATNKDGEFTLSLKPGGYDLIITYTGYKSKLIPISSQSDATNLEIEMVKEEKNMEEVVIRASNEVKDGWEKYGLFFLENFIGSTPFSKNCFLQNPEVLKFYYYRRSDKLKVLAEEPLVIINKSLGYMLRYLLDSLVFDYKTELCTYRGYGFYEEMRGPLDTMRIWRNNRRTAYYGSRLHFMHSYFDNTLKENGFVIALLDMDDDTKFNRVDNTYDMAYYVKIDSLSESEIFYPDRISVTYIKRVPETEYLVKYELPRDIGVQISYVDIFDPIRIKQNGYYYDQRNWINYGYWSWKNIADQVPNDYVPDR